VEVPHASVTCSESLHSHFPDKNGHTLPPDLAWGTYRLLDLNDAPLGSLYEGKVIVDKTYGHASYSCVICCGPNNPWMVYSPISLAVNGSTNQAVQALNSCTQHIVTVTGDFPTWWTDNTSIATASNTQINGVAVGTTNHNAQSINMYWGPRADSGGGDCPLSQEAPSAPTNVQSVTLTLSPAAVLPGGQSTVTVTVQPAASGVSVSLSISGSLYTGGHQHSARPTGAAASYSGTTNSNGQWSTQYTASAFGGTEDIAGSSGTAGTDQKTIIIAVPGLVLLGSGSNYSLVGSTATHPSNHYGTPTANSDLATIANQYAAAFPGGSLNYNDQSLIQGGLFDINADWTTPHVEHRLGINCDVSETNIPAANRPTLTAIFTNNGSPNYLDEGNHWHLRFGTAGNPAGD
jgi:hypothetical protein